MGDAASSAGSPPDELRPVVQKSMGGNGGLWMFIAILIVGGALLFQALTNRRLEGNAPATQYGSGGGTISSPPPLDLPAQFFGAGSETTPIPMAGSLPPPPRGQVPYFPDRAITRIVDVAAPQSFSPAAQPLQPSFAGELPPVRPAIVYDATVVPRQVAGAAGAAAGDERVLATRLANPAVTVPKGTVIPAVLESALDSTRAGAVRAIVSRDVMGFDGSRVLIPRGSRLYGEYASDLNYGQNRALVRWTRLLRPDGAMINLDSPAADPLGRAGIKGKVNGHFWSRFGSSILQSVLDIGTGLATRQIDEALVVALPGSTQNVSRVATENQQQVMPTLTVKQGTSVSVFVAKDLDFSPVET